MISTAISPYLFTLLIPLALLFDKIFGELPNKIHPVALLGNWTVRCERLLRASLAKVAQKRNNPKLASNKQALRITGMLAALLASLPFVLIPFLVHLALYNYVYAQLLWAGLCLYLCIAPNSLAKHTKAVITPLEEKNLQEAKEAVSAIVGRSTENMDSYAVGRACIESVSENVTDGVFSSLFWFSVGFTLCGIEGAILFMLIHRAFNTLDAMWGKRNNQYQYFGTFAARFDDVLNFLPARLSLIAICLAAPMTPHCDWKRALKIGYKYRYAHNSPNSAWSEATFAGALDLKLGGPVRYGSLFVNYPYFGEGSPNVQVKDIENALRLMWNSVLVFCCISSLIIVLF